MMWNRIARAGVAVAVLASAAACSDGSQSTGPMTPSTETTVAANQIYDQIEFLGNPLVSEVTIVKANHESYNRTQPYNTATFRPQTEAFVKSFGRSQTLASTLGSVLYPDMIIVDTTKPTNSAGWLSWALAAGWGGRKLSDDVVDLGLTAIFSSFLDAQGALCQPFKLPLCTDNVPANDAAFSSTFPYLATPH